MKDSDVVDDIELWSDSHLAPGHNLSVDATTDPGMCRQAPLSVQQSRPIVTLYSKADYAGVSKSFTQDNSNLDNTTLKDLVKSLKIQGDATVTLFRDTLFKGVSQVFTQSVPDLSTQPIGTDVDSLKIDLRGPQSQESLNALMGLAATTTQPTVQKQKVNPSACRPAMPLDKEYAYDQVADGIKVLQDVLKCLGYISNDTITTRHYGDATRFAVMQFQKDHSLSKSGNFGPLTRKALNDYLMKE